MVNDVAISIGAISSDELHETASSIKSNENVIDTSVSRSRLNHAKAEFQAQVISVSVSPCLRAWGWIAMSSISDSLFVYSFVDKNASS